VAAASQLAVSERQEWESSINQPGTIKIKKWRVFCWYRFGQVVLEPGRKQLLLLLPMSVTMEHLSVLHNSKTVHFFINKNHFSV